VAAAMALAAGPVGAAQPYHLPKAAGKYCAGLGLSKKKPPKSGKNRKGKSPFAQCVNAVAKVNKNNNISPAKACKGVPKKKARGQKRTSFSGCVAAVKKAKNDLG
jgi:hypothetical protein